MPLFNVKALDSVSFDLRHAEVHAVCGENGAGKSTLMKVISGQLQPDEGRIFLAGQPTRFASTREAEAAGIAMIHQELNLVPHLTVAENIFLAREPKKGPFIDRAKLHAGARRCLARLGVEIEPTAIVRTLSVAQRQMVEIAKTLSIEATVLIMDEPTSSLTASETNQLFKVIRELKLAGVAVVYISHRLDEMAEIVDRVTVLRDGRHVCTEAFVATSVDEIVVRMVGRALDDKFPPRRSVPTSEVLMSVQSLGRRKQRQPGESGDARLWRHHFEPEGCTSRYMPPPSNMRIGRSPGFAFLTAISVSLSVARGSTSADKPATPGISPTYPGCKSTYPDASGR